MPPGLIKLVSLTRTAIGLEVIVDMGLEKSAVELLESSDNRLIETSPEPPLGRLFLLLLLVLPSKVKSTLMSGADWYWQCGERSQSTVILCM